MMKIFWSLVFLLLSFPMWSQKDSSSQDFAGKDVKVGIVLSGGGAKGLAHIGVLKAIDKAGIRVDYIAGSSMGAIIGGLYAAGYSADQLDSIFEVTNFSALIQDDLPRRSKDFYTKEGSKRYALTLPFDDFKLSFPSGLSGGQNVYNLLARLSYPVREINDFSKLPIPFFAIGTDIESGERLVLDKGSLPKSMLASGAIPSLFKPVDIDGKLISDGGITDNYPVEELRKKGVDYIIGVDVQDSLKSRKDLKSVFEILTQVNNFRTIKAMKIKSGRTDLYIKPDITDFSIISFDKGPQIIKSGEKAGDKFFETFKTIANHQNHDLGNRTQIRAVAPDSLIISEIDIKGIQNYKRSYVKGKIQLPIHEKISYKSLSDGMNNLAATDNYDWVGYTLEPAGTHSDQLNLDLKESSNRTKVRFGLHYDQLYKSAALVNFTHKNLWSKNDHISLDAIIGDNFRYKFDYFIDKGNYWSIGLRSRLTQFKDNVDFNFLEDEISEEMSNINKIQLHYFDLTNQFFVETILWRALRFGLGFEYKYTSLKTETVLLNDNEDTNYSVLEKSHDFGPYGYLEYDGYDNPYFPNEGAYFRGDFHSYLFSSGTSFDFERFAVLKGKLGYAFSPFKDFSVRLSGGLGVQFGHSHMRALDFSLGGYGNDFVNNIEPFFGYDFNSAVGDSYIKSGIQIDYQPIPKNHILLGYNIANIGDDLFKHGDIFKTPKYSGVSIGYGLETFLGPMELHYTFSPEKVSRSQWFVSLGFWF